MAQSQTQAVTQPAAQSAKAKSAFVFASVTPEVAKTAGHATAKAVVACEKAKRTLLANVQAALASITVPLTAAQYDRQFKPYLTEGFARSVKRGDISQKTADQYASKLKTAVLAILSGVATPQAGETFWEFYDRAAQALPAATISQGDKSVPVWEASAKRGRKAGQKSSTKTGGAVPKAVSDANASAATSGTGGFDRSAPMAAALILSRGNERRAQLLVSILKTHAETFDRWAESMLTPEEQKAIGKASKAADAKAADVTVLEAGKPATALADQLVAAQRKVNERRRKSA